MNRSSLWTALRPAPALVVAALLAGCQPTASGQPPTPAHPPVAHASATPHPITTESPPSPAAHSPGAPAGVAWPMFMQNERHTGSAPGSSEIRGPEGPRLRWVYPLVPGRGPTEMRWASSFPLGDLDGDGTLEVVVTSPDYAAGLTPRVVVLKDAPGQSPAVRQLWTFVVPGGETAGVDQYGAALADADGDGRLDVIFSARDGWLRALRGFDGRLIWQFNTGRIMEAGPMIADLDGDGALEVIQATDCLVADCRSGGALFVVPVRASGDNRALWSLELPWKSDSGEPAIADLDPSDGQDRKAVVFGSWGGLLTVAWQQPSGEVVRRDFDLRQLDPAIPLDSDKVVVRTSPLIVDWGEGPTAVFGWMPDHDIGSDARLSAVRLTADMQAGRVDFQPLWTAVQDTWKSSPALMELPGGDALVVAGTGIGTRFGTSFACEDGVIGGVVARTPSGEVAWDVDLRPQGNVRGSSAVADLDGDGVPEVIVPVGCGGDLVAYDGATGKEEWRFGLGEYTFASPTIGDIDGDGRLDIVIASFDGQVYALESR